MLEGDRINLTPLEHEDLPLIVEWRNQPSVRRWFFDKSLISRSAQEEWYRRYLADPRRQMFVARLKESGDPVGVIGFSAIDAANRSAEIGSTIVAGAARGHGYGAEMVRAMLEYGFRDLNLHRIYAYAIGRNAASIRVKQKCGFRIEGVLREAHYCDGAYADVVLLAILRAEWEEALRNPAERA